jgi:L,D-transpeptidase ErfK/SrfK
MKAFICFSILVTVSVAAFGLTYPLPKNQQDSFISRPYNKSATTTAAEQDTLLDIARRFDLGQNEIVLANPTVDRWLPGEGTKVYIPNSRLLPDTPREGLVLNLPEYRLYYFSNKEDEHPTEVATYPISIGRQDWDTPLGITEIIEKKENPTWTPPESIKREHAAQGEILPDVVPAGANNPLGLFALRLGIPGYLIHSTNKPYGVGMRVSHGCIRMYPEDIAQLFQKIDVGTPVYIVNQPLKVGWLNNSLYIEVYPVLEGKQLSHNDLLQRALNLIEKANNYRIPVLNGEKLNRALHERNGLPIAIFERTPMNSNRQKY